MDGNGNGNDNRNIPEENEIIEVLLQTLNNSGVDNDVFNNIVNWNDLFNNIRQRNMNGINL